MNENLIYKTVPAVADLNSVEGFNPLEYLREIIGDDGGKQLYLDVKYRKLWFRLKYPGGKIRKRIVELNDKYAIIESFIYLDKNDAEENFIASALAQRSASDDGKFSDKYVELAETASVGRALADAGFGVQFCDMSEPSDPNVVDAPVSMPINTETGELIEDSTTKYDPIAPKEENMIAPPVEAAKTNPTKTQAKATAPQATELSPTMSCDDLYKLMSLDDAKRVTVDVGFHKGKTLAHVAAEKPKDLVWYAETYKGNNNMLRIGSKILLEAASV